MSDVYFICGLLFFAFLLLILHMWRQAFLERVQHVEFRFEDFPESFQQISIFFISDIHRRVIRERLVERVTGTDIVIIGGDLIEKGVSFKKVEKNVRQLKKIAPVYFVWGNNDYEVDYHRLDSILLDLGVTVLANNTIHFESSCGDEIALIGVDSVTNKRDDLQSALLESKESAFKVLASHDPKIIEKIQQNDNIKLTLCGHTHGGQIRVFGFGMYEKGGIQSLSTTTLFTSNGFGTTFLPLRLGAPAETHLITIKSQKTN